MSKRKMKSREINSSVPSSDSTAAKGPSVTTFDSQHMMTRLGSTLTNLEKLLAADTARQHRGAISTERRQADSGSDAEIPTGQAVNVALDERPLESLCPFRDRDELLRRSSLEKLEERKQTRMLLAAIDAQARADRADSKTDTKNLSPPLVPENFEVATLARLINANPDGDRSQLAIAIRFKDGDETKAKSLLRQLRRFPNLLNKR